MIEFTVQGDRYAWDPVNQQIYTNGGRSQTVYCETDSGGLCDIRQFKVNGRQYPIPTAFKAQKTGTLRVRLQSIKAAKALSVETLQGWRMTVQRSHWSVDDIVFITACLNSIARLSKDQDHRQLFGELVGLHLLTLAQTALLYQLLQDTFNITVSSKEAGDREKEYQKRGGKPRETWRGKSLSDETDEQEDNLNEYNHNAPEYSSPVDSDELTNITNRMAGISLNGSLGWTQALQHVADSLKATTSTVSLASWTTPLDSLTHNLTQSVSPIAAAIMQHRRHAGTVFYVVLIGMVLNNWRALAHFQGASDYVFFDNRPPSHRDGPVSNMSLSGLSTHDLFNIQPLTEQDRRSAGAYLHVLNLFPPVPIIGQLFSFSEEAYWQSVNETSGAIQSFFVDWLGNPAESQRVRLNYASAHVAMSLLFVFMLTHTISRRPFGMPAIGNWTAWAAGWAFVLLLIQRIVSNFPFWAWNSIA